MLGPLDHVKHSDICVRPDQSWNVSRTSVRPAWPLLHYTEYPRPAAALTPTVLQMDSQSAIAIMKNPQFHNWTKHIEVRHHFLCRQVEEEKIELDYIPTNDQVADTLTKGLNQEKHMKFAKEMGLGCPV